MTSLSRKVQDERVDHEDLWESPLTSSRADQTIRFRFRTINGRLECVGVEVIRERHPITTSFMREIRWSELIEAKKQINLKRAHSWARRKGLPTSRLPSTAELIQEAERMIPEWEASLGSGRGGRPRELQPEHFATVAEVYSAAFAAGIPPTREVAQRFNVSRSTAAKWVARARDARLLPRTKQRVARGRPARKEKR